MIEEGSEAPWTLNSSRCEIPGVDRPIGPGRCRSAGGALGGSEPFPGELPHHVGARGPDTDAEVED